MKVWASRRREDGAALASALPVVEGASLLELLVVDVTLEGNRRPSKVARLYPIGEQRILAQLAMPKLVQLKGWTVALSGIEERRDELKKVRGTAQTWILSSMCRKVPSAGEQRKCIDPVWQSPRAR